MSKINDGCPAFPVPEENYISNGTYSNPGMTLRDWFAGQALNGMLSPAPFRENVTYREIADGAYRWADAMLAAREGETP